MKSYLFSLGNSTDGPVGFCARVKGTSPEDALAKLRAALPEVVEVLDGNSDDDAIEYLNVYINPDAVTVEGIEDQEPICKKCGTSLTDEGECRDPTCPYSNRQQDET